MKKNQRVVLAVLLVGVITLSSVLILNKLLGPLRLDLTEKGIYSLSDGTKKITSGLNQDIKLKLFYARTAAMKGPEGIKYYNNYYLYVRELLREYEGLSGNKLKLEVIDPRPFSDEEEEALNYGIKKFPISENENFFFGLAAVSEMGKDAVIPFFEPARQEFVEYDISKLITQVIQREKSKVGVLSSISIAGADLSPYMRQMLQMQGRPAPQPWNLISHLRQEYQVVALNLEDKEIPADVDFLMVVHPKNFSDTTLYAIDQYVMKGGKLLVMVDPFSIVDQPQQNPQNPMAAYSYDSSSNLNKLLKNWGVEMLEGEIAADPEMGLTAQLRQDAPPSKVVTFLQLGEDNVNKDEVISGKLHDMKMVFAGVLKINEKAGTEVTPLLTTTAAGGSWKPQSPFELRMPNPQAMASGMKVSEEPVMLACRINGKFKSNFPDGPPAGKAEGETKAPTPAENHLKESNGEAAVVVVADVDIASDQMAYQQSFFGVAQVGDGASLVLNSLDFLSGSSELIEIRSRGQFKRPFLVVDAIEAEAEKATEAEVAETNQKISEFQARLQELGANANVDNEKLIQSKALAERNDIQKEIRKAQKKLRKLQAGRRENIESLGLLLQTVNMVLAPAVVLVIAIFLGIRRFNKAKKYAERRTQE